MTSPSGWQRDRTENDAMRAAGARLLDGARRSVHASDALSAELADLRVCAMIAGVSELRGSWGLGSPAGPGGFYAILEGRAVVTSDHVKDWVELGAGDVMIISEGAAHAICSERGVKARPALEVFGPAEARRRAGVKVGSGGALTRMLCGAILIEPNPGRYPVLPKITVWRGAGRAGSLMQRAVLGIAELCADERPGTQALMSHLGAIVLIEAIREQLGSGRGDGEPLTAVLDAHVGPTIGLMRHRPEHPWTLGELANEAGLSRTTYYERFTGLVGEAPLRFLRELRMRRAAERLHDPDADVREVARAVGYSSESAFSSAFKRWSGRSPLEFRKGAKGA